MRFSRARLFALVATLVALLAAAAPVRTHFFCHMRERVVSACCCPKAATHAKQVAQPTASAPDCCERIASASRAAVAAPHDANATVPSAAMVAILAVSEGVEPPREVALSATAQARAPPAVGPPAFISFCRLLI
jgi:hypothetical protein